MVTSESIDESEFARLTEPLVGLAISKAFSVVHPSVNIDFGKLRPIQMKRRVVTEGQASVMYNYSWRIERPRTILFGSDSSERKIDAGLVKLIGKKVLSIGLEGSLREIAIELDGGLTLRSVACYQGSGHWCLFLKDKKRFPCRSRRVKKPHSLWLTTSGAGLKIERGM